MKTKFFLFAFFLTLVNTIQAQFSISLTADTTTICQGSSVTIRVRSTGARDSVRYVWTHTSSNDSTFVLSPNSIQTYSVTATSGAQMRTAFIIINVLPSPNVQTVSTNVSCAGGQNGSIITTTTSGVPPYTYLWSNGRTTSFNNGLSVGIYVLTVTGTNTCRDTVSTIIREPPKLENTFAITPSSCGFSNASILSNTIGGVLPYAYAWSNGATINPISNLSAGIYTVTVRDANNCTIVADTLINPSFPMVATITPTSATCNSPNGRATVTVNGGNSPYTYVWSNGDTTAIISNIRGGNYTVTVRDANNCTAITSATVSTTSLNYSFQTTPVTCTGMNDGAIALQAVGGTAPFGFRWSNGFITSSLSNLSTGNYFFTITDSIGCTVSDTILLEARFPNFPVTILVNNICGSSQGSLTAIATGAQNPRFLWSRGDTTQILNSSTAGNYFVRVTDTNGCEVVDSANLTTYSFDNFTLEGFSEADSVSITVSPITNNYNWELQTLSNATQVFPSNAFGSLIDSLGNQYYLAKQIIPPTNTTEWVSFTITPFANTCLGESKTIQIRVLAKTDYTDETGGLFIPEVFTPNADGANDTWEIVYTRRTIDPANYEVQVFNRNGIKVFHADALPENWDGENLPAGAYYYLIKNKTDNKIIKGAVSIIR